MPGTQDITALPFTPISLVLSSTGKIDNMTRIKICGIANADDARAASDLGADALGFIFVPGSPRFVGGDAAALGRLLRSVPPFVWRVGVFDTPPDDLALAANLHALQYYNAAQKPSSMFADGPGRPLAIRAFRVRDENSLREIAEYQGPMDAALLDAYSATALGGTGHTFNWDLARQAKAFGVPIVLAGGLTPENVGDAVRAVRPYMVDVSSGVEAAPGRKAHDKVRRFIRAVRAADLDIAGGD
jgi:phosphoribosylanthranilate isomerase